MCGLGFSSFDVLELMLRSVGTPGGGPTRRLAVLDGRPGLDELIKHSNGLDSTYPRLASSGSRRPVVREMYQRIWVAHEIYRSI